MSPATQITIGRSTSTEFSSNRNPDSAPAKRAIRSGWQPTPWTLRARCRRCASAKRTSGRYDGATVETLLVNWREPTQFALLRTATIGKITRSDGRFVAELESLAQQLDQPRGRYVRRSCDAELGDRRCGFLLSQPGFSGAGAVLAQLGPGVISVSGLDGVETGWFSHGVLTWQTGENAGRSVRIVDHRVQGTATVLTLWQDGAAEPQAGDGFTLVAGCDKTFATCKAKFANGLNFRGFPHLPGNDAGYAYVTDGGQFDGGALVP